ncbi:helix-turn-helix domain-containing protein [Mangrovimonas sp. YM274]|uniref:helix-turn-helix domain-containing protein n=1 Tax=Mangrovimonas sp. YM274 TaxID=3070660 RepID=UPI0027DDDF52|nr:helix-turn-helix domain-containing protein [Mangrovimonas sp. YM274]WMI69361.1 helix-turn-helix domain-containing protein [Mangrovimonas sp. YM274]
MDSEVSMNKAFLIKLNEILEENYHDEHFGVRELSASAGVSRSKLHRKLNEIKGQSASEFIKQFRLNKANLLLLNNVSSISEIAYAVGFNSPSYFSKCFKDHYKCLPGEVKNKREKFKGKRSLNGLNLRIKTFGGKKSNIILLGILIGLVVVFLASVVNKNDFKSKKEVVIGVLPFKSLSGDPENQYFADGVMDIILSNLSGIDGFSLISRTTMEQYRGANKSIPEISKELNISYVLEASVQKYEGRVRIVAQLIDAKNDVHIWSDDYEKPFEDIFELQSEIAKEVAKQLELTISPTELQRIDHKTTENFEAFNMYLKGRFFWHRRTEEDLKKSIYYFEEAIKIDPNYALAYAGLADSYNIMASWGWFNKAEGYRKGREFALKALSIDDKLASAYAILGYISTWYDWNWRQAEKELKTAIELDPDYPIAYLSYAILLDILGKKKEAREQIDLALKFNPNSTIIYYMSSMIYYNNKEFDKSLEHLKKSEEIRGEPWPPYYLRNYMRLGKDNLAFEQIKFMLNGKNVKEFGLDSIFHEIGIKGVLDFTMDSLFYDVRGNYYNLAAFSCLSDNPQRALDYLEMSYETREMHIPRMKHSIDFETIREYPRFVNLLEKMNLKD